MSGGGFPHEIGSWSVDDIRHLCSEYPIDTDWLVFEEDLSDTLPLKAASLANSGGGFIVFGVSSTGDEREITGVEPDKSFTQKMAELFSVIDPNIMYEMQTNLELDNTDNVLHVVMVPRSPSGLHMLDNIFYKRRGGTSVPMEATEVYRGVLSTEQRRRKFKIFKEKLASLTVELETVQEDLRHYQVDLINEASELKMLLNDILPFLLDDMDERLGFTLMIIGETVELLKLETSKHDFVALRLLTRFLSRELVPELIEIADELDIDLEKERKRRAIAEWQARIVSVKG